ncbi:MAG TPA: hypothetical protein VNB03_00225 [Casimicrobiaceae bacterium]|jgi:hypothetical protein|nr:hypothetical protein [Casimicrobiaceae bacterium]
MPHVDELLGPATFAAAGLFAAIALQPPLTGVAPTRVAPGATSIAAPTRQAIVPLPTVEVVARRSTALAQIERDDAPVRGAGRPGA